MFFAWQGKSQVLNQNAGWPNAAWTVSGTYNPLGLESDPTSSANFGFNDDIAGNGSDDDIAVESPVINLTPAHTAGEQILRINVNYHYRFLTGDVLSFEYWNADTASWVIWGSNLTGNSTTTTVDFCTPEKVSFTSTDLNIAGFTPTQLSGFKYRIYYNDNIDSDAWNWGFCFDSPTIVSAGSPTVIPGCATLLTPADGATFAIDEDVVLTWSAPTTGSPATSYDIFIGETADNLVLLTNVTDTQFDGGPIGAYNTTYFWQVIPKNSAGSATGCTTVWSFTSESSPGYCLTAPFGQYPIGTAGYTPNTCDGLTVNEIVADAYAGEYSLVNVVAGQTYTFESSVATDFITIGSADGLLAEEFGVTPLTWVASTTGQIRFYIHLDDQCGDEQVGRVKTIVCDVSAALPDFVNLQFPLNIEINQGESDIVYGRVYEAGLTDTTSGQAPGINAWVGISPIGENTNPNTWTTWIPATFNTEVQDGNDDEYQASIGANLAPGTYYYATRFQLNGGAFVYGGKNANADGGFFWDGTNFVSGTLVVSPPPAPENDNCASSTVIVQQTGIADAASATPTAGTIQGATDSSVPAEACAGFTGVANDDVWYSFVALTETVNITYEVTGTAFDAVAQLYSNACGEAVDVIACADATVTTAPIVEQIQATGLEIGATYYTRIYQYSGTLSTIGKSFNVKIWTSETLSNNEFDDNNFTYYPNPTKNILNLSYNKEISNVEVFNLIGQKVSETKLNANSGQVDTSNLASGAYFVKVTSNNASKTIKVIKE